MPSPDSQAVAAALLAVLANDATLAALLPDGVWSDSAKQGATRFAVVSLLDHTDDWVFEGRAIESALYLVKATVQGQSADAANQAAARIDALLEDIPLTAAGYNWMSTNRETYLRVKEVDDVDPAIVWQHRGGHYRVEMSIVGR